MQIAATTLKALAGMITGDNNLAPYQTLSNIYIFFNSLNIESPNRGSGSRGPLVVEYLEMLNGSPNLDKVIQATFHPSRFLEVKEGKMFDVESAVNNFNQYLIYDGFQLIKEGLVYKCKKVPSKTSTSGNEKIKNLIFASTGPKPEIVLIDATNNDLRITKNAKYCLIYDKSIPHEGLMWSDLITWWGEQQQKKLSHIELERSLYARLYQSIQSKPEQLFFRAYFKLLRSLLEENLLALLPQVYLHYDPYTIAQLAGNKRLQRQRMDFLLLTEAKRIVIEIDGIQHYSAVNSDGAAIADPRTYGEMVHEDRRLKLAGYELFRFGGHELQKEDEVEAIVKDFFCRLLKL